jgi:hypothetical protein
VSPAERAASLEYLAELNAELRERGGRPTYPLPEADRYLDDDQLDQAVRQTLQEVRALREWG